MSDERLELPLFEAPDEAHSEIEELFDDPRVDSAPQPSSAVEGDATEVAPRPVVIEPIDLETLEMPDETPTPLPIDQPTMPIAVEAQAQHQPVVEPLPESSPATPTPPSGPASAVNRLAAGSADLIVHLALAAVLAGGSALLGIEVGLRHALPLAIAVGAFSFVYHVVPLAFWGRTPGMAIVGLRARTADDEPLSMPQAIRRWVGGVLSLATLGLGTLAGLTDRLSGSKTSRR